MDMELVKSLCQDSTLEVTDHIMKQMRKRSISYEEVKQAIMTGEVIEDYPTAYPYPAALLLGITLAGRKLHVVIGVGEDRLWLVTTYVPDPTRWDETLCIRKE